MPQGALKDPAAELGGGCHAGLPLSLVPWGGCLPTFTDTQQQVRIRLCSSDSRTESSSSSSSCPWPFPSAMREPMAFPMSSNDGAAAVKGKNLVQWGRKRLMLLEETCCPHSECTQMGAAPVLQCVPLRTAVVLCPTALSELLLQGLCQPLLSQLLPLSKRLTAARMLFLYFCCCSQLRKGPQTRCLLLCSCGLQNPLPNTWSILAWVSCFGSYPQANLPCLSSLLSPARVSPK